MADIANELQTIATAIYGSEMRTAIHDAIEKVNNDTTSLIIGDYSNSGFTPNTEYAYEIKAYYNGMLATVTVSIQKANGRTGYDPDVPDTGIVLATLPSDLIPSNCAAKAMFPGYFPDQLDVPYVSITDSDNELKIFNAYDEILGDQNTFIVNLVYFVVP